MTVNFLHTYLSTAYAFVGGAVSSVASSRSNATSTALVDSSHGSVTSVFETLDTTPEGLVWRDVVVRAQNLGGRHAIGDVEERRQTVRRRLVRTDDAEIAALEIQRDDIPDQRPMMRVASATTVLGWGTATA